MPSMALSHGLPTQIYSWIMSHRSNRCISRCEYHIFDFHVNNTGVLNVPVFLHIIYTVLQDPQKCLDWCNKYVVPVNAGNTQACSVSLQPK